MEGRFRRNVLRSAVLLIAGAIIGQVLLQADEQVASDNSERKSAVEVLKLPPPPEHDSISGSGPASDDSSSSVTAEIPAPLAAEAVEEILRLRRLLGTADLLPGGARSGSAHAHDEQFRQALQSLVGQPVESTAPRTIAPESRAERLPELMAPNTGAGRFRVRTQVRQASGDENEAILESSSADLEVVASLRETSRMLDNRAHDLDAEQRFNEAEKLRQLSGRLRKEARRIESTARAYEASVTPQR